METTTSQPFIFIITLYGGLLAGIAYDVYRSIRKAVKCGKWSTAVLDTLFILTLGLIVMFVMFTANEGELRLFTFVGFVLGFALYMIGLSPFISYLAKKIKNRIKKNNKNSKIDY